MGIETAITMALIGGSSLAGGLAGRSKKQTSQTTPQFSPNQLHTQNLLSGYLEHELMSPNASLPRLKTAAVDKTNKVFKGAGKRLEGNLAARGFERSGAMERGLTDIEIGRGDAIAGIESDFAGKELDRKDRLAQMLMQYSFASPGSETVGTSPNNMWSGAINGGLETASFLYGLNMFGGGGKPDPYSGSGI